MLLKNVNSKKQQIGECTDQPNCAWCLSSNTCGNDNSHSCKTGPKDHVGKLKGALGKCGVVGFVAKNEILSKECEFTEATSCGECTDKPNCAWCLTSSKCVNDVRLNCPNGPENHVGKGKGSLGKCDDTTVAGIPLTSKNNFEKEVTISECNFKYELISFSIHSTSFF